MHIYPLSFEHSKSLIYLVEIFDVAFSLILSARCVQRHTHILNALIEVLFSGVEVFKHTFMLFFCDRPRGVSFAFIHHDLILSPRFFIFFFLFVSLQVGRNLALAFCPSNLFHFIFLYFLINRLQVILSLLYPLLILFDVVLLVAYSCLLLTFHLLTFRVNLSILKSFSCNFRRHLCKFLNLERFFSFCR